jgi:hypothetical protein
MNAIAFTLKGKPYKFHAPQIWNQVTGIQLIRWAAVAFNNFSEGDQGRYALMIMYDIPAKVFNQVPERFAVQFVPTISFLFLQNKLTRWLMPQFKIGRRRYYGPADALSNISAHEFFNYTEVLYQQWRSNQDPRTLNAFCAVLYRKRRKDEVLDDVRVPLTDAGVSLRAKRFESLHTAQKHAILLNYEGCRAFIIEKYPTIFKKGGNLQHNKTPKDLVLTLSDGPFGNYNDTQHANIYKFLQHAESIIEQAEANKPNS